MVWSQLFKADEYPCIFVYIFDYCYFFVHWLEKTFIKEFFWLPVNYFGSFFHQDTKICGWSGCHFSAELYKIISVLSWGAQMIVNGFLGLRRLLYWSNNLYFKNGFKHIKSHYVAKMELLFLRQKTPYLLGWCSETLCFPSYNV